MTQDMYPYLNAILRVIEKLREGVYDALSSFGHCSKFKMIIKLGKLNLYYEILDEILPEDFDSNISAIKRHIHFLDHYYSKDKNFSMFKQNADDILKEDIPPLKGALNEYFKKNKTSGQITKTSTTRSCVEQIIHDIKENLRRLVRKEPDGEKEVQDHLEDLLALKGYQFEREQVSIPYSTKKYIPDFTSEKDSIAIDVKFCDSSEDERRIIDEINADIPAYKLKYKHILFVPYDMAIIRRLKDYASGIEENHQNVHVIIIKH